MVPGALDINTEMDCNLYFAGVRTVGTYVITSLERISLFLLITEYHNGWSIILNTAA